MEGLKKAVALSMAKGGVVLRERGPRRPAHDPKGWVSQVAGERRSELSRGRRRSHGARRHLKVFTDAVSYNAQGAGLMPIYVLTLINAVVTLL